MRRAICIDGLALCMAVVLVATLAVGAAAGSGTWQWPLEPIPHVVRYFEPPDSPYGAGHRGVDLAGTVGEQVLAIGAGRVTFAGSVAGVGVIVVDHGQLASTYQPVKALVPVGATVSAGQPIGWLELVHSHCLPDACLHLGVRRGETYIDPLSLLGPRPVRLKPLAGLDHGVEPGFPPSRRGTSAASAATAALCGLEAGFGTQLHAAAPHPPQSHDRVTGVG